MNKYLVNAYNAVNRAKDYASPHTDLSDSENGILMGAARILDENSEIISDAGECGISIYKGDDTDAYKEFKTNNLGEFDIELEPGEYNIEATTAKGDYTSGRLGFTITKSEVSYMDYLLLFVLKIGYSVADGVLKVGEKYIASDKKAIYYKNNMTEPGRKVDYVRWRNYIFYRK